MQIQILGQGYEPKSELSVGKQLIKFLSDKEFHSFTAIAAFASQAGVNGLSKHINEAKKHITNFTIVVGVNQKATSKEALDALNNLDINSYVFYAPPPFPIFHPKVYLFEGNDKSELIIGSSNITRPGLYSNVELSLLVTINNHIAEDIKIITQLKEYFNGIFEGNDPNLKVITEELIADFVTDGIVPTESEIREEREKNKSREKSATESIISKIFPKREAAKIPIEFIAGNKPKQKINSSINTTTVGKTETGNLVWTRKKLPASSVQQTPSGHDTGGLRLVKGDFFVEGLRIDQTKYFRDVVFNKYKWKEIKRPPFVEIVTIPFEITILGKFIGKHELVVRHKPSGEAGQGNYSTLISWGEIGDTIKDSKLTGKRLDLYTSKDKSQSFQIIIS